MGGVAEGQVKGARRKSDWALFFTLSLNHSLLSLMYLPAPLYLDTGCATNSYVQFDKLMYEDYTNQ